jgi:hypothetical protein
MLMVASGTRPGPLSKGFVSMYPLVAYYLGRPASAWRAALPQPARRDGLDTKASQR